jgi:hypothetical protein
MAANWKKTLIGLSVLFIRPSWAQTLEFSFYEDECYGSPNAPAASFVGELIAGSEVAYPGGHFISVGDGCGAENCFALTYRDNNCNSYVVDYGSGCYNIDVGFEPTNVLVWCDLCELVPAAGYQKTC